MTIRVDVSRLPEDVAEAIRSGEPIEFEDAGEVVAKADAQPAATDWKAFFEERAKDPPLDYDEFIADLEMIRRELNHPAENRWPS